MQSVSASSDVELVVQLHRHAAGYGSGERLRETILSTRFFAQAPEQPGFLALPAPGGPLIAVFTTEHRLARHAGAVRWFSTTGADLMSMAPVGHRFIIDPGSPHAIVIDPDVFVRATDGGALPDA